jgi:glycosyltransferase involved in cell wall biosynthesis
LSVVVPVYNEQEVLPKFHSRISDVLDSIDGTSEIVYANDGSNDGTLPLLHDLHSSDPRVAIVELSRNFGKEIALTAGLDYCRGETVVVIDADLQDPPELIPELMCRWRDGYDVVYSTRMTREGETFAKRFTGEHSTG